MFCLLLEDAIILMPSLSRNKFMLCGSVSKTLSKVMFEVIIHSVNAQTKELRPKRLFSINDRPVITANAGEHFAITVSTSFKTGIWAVSCFFDDVEMFGYNCLDPARITKFWTSSCTFKSFFKIRWGGQYRQISFVICQIGCVQSCW